MSKQNIAFGLVALTVVGTGPARAQPAEAEIEAQYVEIQQARTQMDEARRQLEQAARTIAGQIQVPGGNWEFDFDVDSLQGLVITGQGRIGVRVVDADNGALVTAVTPGSGAEEAGIRVGDVIRSVAGTDVTSGDDEPAALVVANLRETEPGDTVAVVVERAGETLDFDVQTAEGSSWVSTFSGPGQGGWRFQSAPDGPAVIGPGSPNTVFLRRGLRYLASSPWSEMELVAVSESLGRYFDTSVGLLVVSGPEDETIDIQDGDVILEISGRTPNSPEHAIRMLSSFEGGETIEFSIMRDGRRETIEYAMPAAQWGTAIGGDAPTLPVPAPD